MCNKVIEKLEIIFQVNRKHQNKIFIIDFPKFQYFKLSKSHAIMFFSVTFSFSSLLYNGKWKKLKNELFINDF